MNIKKVSEQTGVSADTIRYYERIGLLPRVRRNKSGIRDFSEQDIATLEFIRCFRRAGMSVESLIEYMNLVEQGEGTEEARMHLLQEQRDKLDARIDELLATRNRMDYKIKNYQNILLEKENVLFDEKPEE
ncbi:MerR family transcriptional regulator [Streptococcus equinus ATCC 33317]|jgi:DNA-binding transcriptional MerR regulator|uniref:DNA-binding transcriptional regulator, MerR family n=2 Tax=Streptococcus equinus TaxID=1335 RepID=A0A239R9V2_STREI|nr:MULTISPECIES: stress response transcriptional regulator NmlR [Streptococcus]EQC69562.1 putative transcriptional regulator (MerRfamily) [Streptococcus sp. HSISB1]KFN85609.1 MerR family transcriptional regulator [Streptococcus equinus ATCC 33317]MCR5493522.1 MerR family transcriptional regulator [Streptococcus sp.]MEE0950145.1 stress response transcriptional regulator NmlR [Streptococcus equinus]SNU07617.1 DNA-binding transcriptional regulator, MerR family [Streptococcus equinus]